MKKERYEEEEEEEEANANFDFVGTLHLFSCR